MSYELSNKDKYCLDFHTQICQKPLISSNDKNYLTCICLIFIIFFDMMVVLIENLLRRFIDARVHNETT